MKNIYTLKLKYSNPQDTLICVTINGYYWKYFSSNEYHGISKAKEAARKWLRLRQNTEYV